MCCKIARFHSKLSGLSCRRGLIDPLGLKREIELMYEFCTYPKGNFNVMYIRGHVQCQLKGQVVDVFKQVGIGKAKNFELLDCNNIIASTRSSNITNTSSIKST